MPRNSYSHSHNTVKDKQYNCLLQIENFPSRYEIYKALDLFLAERHLPAEYEASNKDNTIQLLFKHSVCNYYHSFIHSLSLLI